MRTATGNYQQPDGRWATAIGPRQAGPCVKPLRCYCHRPGCLGSPELTVLHKPYTPMSPGFRDRVARAQEEAATSL